MLGFFLKFPGFKNFASFFVKKIIHKTDQFTIGKLEDLPSENLQLKHLRNCMVVPDRKSFLMNLPSCQIVAELGVDKGEFSELILEITKPKKLFLIDSWASSSKYYGSDQVVMRKFKNEIEVNTIEIRKGFSLSEMSKFPDNTFDLIYIDTVHDYILTKKELNVSATKIKKNGIIAGHDYTIRSRDNGLKLGVVEAVHEFCLEHNWEFFMISLETNGHNSFALKKCSIS